MKLHRYIFRYFLKAAFVAILLGATSCALPHPARSGTRFELPANATYEVIFSPSVQAEQTIIGFIQDAQTSVHVAAYAFTSRPIAQALLDARARGVDVRVMVDKGQAAGRYSAATFLANQAVAIRVDGEYKLQHQKVVIVDGVSVETGSYNFTASARDRNSENVIIIRNAPELAARYEVNWEKMWDESVVMVEWY
jgi:phosphatidylserine/phosphatidylglycerophosphate/cardiolipin synthase-like enzyme